MFDSKILKFLLLYRYIRRYCNKKITNIAIKYNFLLTVSCRVSLDFSKNGKEKLELCTYVVPSKSSNYVVRIK